VNNNGVDLQNLGYRANEWIDQGLNRVQTASFEHENKEFVFL